MGGVSFHMEKKDFIVRPHLTNLNKQFFCNSRPPWLFIQTNNRSIQLFPVSCYSSHLEPQHFEKITPTKKRRICVIISWWTFPSKLGFNMKKNEKRAEREIQQLLEGIYSRNSWWFMAGFKLKGIPFIYCHYIFRYSIPHSFVFHIYSSTVVM